MNKINLSLVLAALATLGITGCAVDTDTSPAAEDVAPTQEEVASTQEALSCYVDGVYWGECGDPDGDGLPGGETVCSECEYVPARRGYFIVCSGRPTTFEPCTP